MSRPPHPHGEAFRIRRGLVARGLLILGLVAGLSTRPAQSVEKSEAAVQLEFGVKVALKGSWNEAAFRFEKAVRADEGNARAWNNLGVARESLGHLDAAREAYEKARALAPGDDKISDNYERFRGYLRSIHKDSGAP